MAVDRSTQRTPSPPPTRGAAGTGAPAGAPPTGAGQRSIPPRRAWLTFVVLLVINYLVVRFLYNHEKLDRLIEGECAVLIEDGEVKHDRLKKELITHAELEAAAHKQGFGSLDDIDRAILDPGGIVSFVARKPSADDTRHGELLARLDNMAAQIAALKAAR